MCTLRFFRNLFRNTRYVSITRAKSKMELLMTEELHLRIFRYSQRRLWLLASFFMNIAFFRYSLGWQCRVFINIPYLDKASLKCLTKMLQICQIIAKLFRDAWDSSADILFCVRKISKTERLKSSQKSFGDILIIKNLINAALNLLWGLRFLLIINVADDKKQTNILLL